MRPVVFLKHYQKKFRLSEIGSAGVGKKSKERIRVALFANAADGKELPVVIGKVAKPRCFKGLSDMKKPAGIPYYSNQKSWMNAEIMNEILTDLNRKLSKEERHILLLLDNATSHDPALRDRFSNIRVLFLPKKTTSRLLPLDAGIKKNSKFIIVVHFCSTHCHKLIEPHNRHPKWSKALTF